MKTYDYYCTWQVQNFLGYKNGVSNRDYLDEKALFNKKNGIVYSYPEQRSSLYFILDDGWDVPYSYNVKENYPFASHIIKEDRFPSFKGKPEEKLKQMVDKIKSFGWKGVGIWVCAQGYDKDYSKSIKGLRNFFKERLLWSKYAGVSYWKVDWGTYCNDIFFRKMLTNLAFKIYPELIIENAMCINPVNGFNNGEDADKKYIFPWNNEMINYINKVTSFSECFRSYDVTEELSTTTTLARLIYLLSKSKAIINAEDEIYLAAVLGCAVGIERNVISRIKDQPNLMNYKTNEVIAYINYRKISSCFAKTKILTSKEIFTDSFTFGPYWANNVENANVIQKCPCYVSRNTSLPKVKALKEIPYVVCAKDLDNNYAIGTFKRLNYGNDADYKVNVTVKISSKVNNIAIFSNHIKTLKVTFKENINANKFYLVNLIDNSKEDVTDKIIVKDNKLIIHYSVLTKKFKTNDLSGKAYILKLN